MLHNICVRYRGSEQLDILRTASFRSSLNGAARALSLLERELDSSLLEAGVFTQAVQSLSTIKMFSHKYCRARKDVRGSKS
jgi:hypothetical protein